MSPRLKLRSVATPLVMAGAVWTAGALAPALGAGHAPIVNAGGAQTPPPCSADGHCKAQPETFGFYQTRWRTFPGDPLRRTPTPADEPGDEVEAELGGPELPTPTEEGLIGPTPTLPEDAAGAGVAPAPADGEQDAAGAGLGAPSGEAPLGGFELPGLPPQPGGEGAMPSDDGAAPPPGGLDDAPLPGPGAEPGSDPLDPFGNAPPAPPAWITSAAADRDAAPQTLTTLPVVEHAVVMEPPAPLTATPTNLVYPGDAPPPPSNLHSDDAPPALPPALAGGFVAPAAPTVTPASATAAPALQQPPSVQPFVVIDDQVEAASAEEPLGIPLVNPAAAVVDPQANGPQQAIYFEASDQ